MVYGDFPPNTDHFTLAENKRLKAELAAAQGNADDNYKKLMECRTELAAERERVRELTEEMQERRDEFAAYRIDVNDRITKLREALERAVVRIKSLQGHDIIDPAIRAVLSETGKNNGCDEK
jgi:predicted  nucleic acid-binding Zn-ribbon protein